MALAHCVLWPRDLQEIAPVHVNFARSLELRGLEFTQEFDRLVLRLRWRILRPIDRQLSCFAHLQGVDGPEQQSMDHELLDGRPALSELRPGDEACERVSLELPDCSRVNAQLRLGVYDSAANLRWPIWSSSRSVEDECTAVVCMIGERCPARPASEFPPLTFHDCNVRWKGGVALVRYGLSRRGREIWLALEWTAERRTSSGWRFFGHAVGHREAESRIWASFDQDLAPATSAWEQNIVRTLPAAAPEPLDLAFGLFDIASERRFPIVGSDLPVDAVIHRVFLPLTEASA